MATKKADGTEGFSAEERAAMRQRAAELRAEAKRTKAEDKLAADSADVDARIAEMPDEDRVLAQRVHAVVMAAAPDLAPKLYYGQPGYALDGKVLCFFRSGQMDKERYSTFGFSAKANLDESNGVWATSYALNDPTDAALQELGAAVKRAVGS